MAKLSVICGFVLISAIYQSEAGPNNVTVFTKLNTMFKALQDVGQNPLDKEYVTTFGTNLASDAARYSIDFNLIYNDSTTIASELDVTFSKAEYYKDDAGKRTAIRTAIETYFAIFNNDFDSCPAYAKLNEILGKVKN